MNVVVNGEVRDVPAGATAGDLIALLGLEGRPLAVEVNEQVVPRRSLPGCKLCEGDRLEIVTLVGGG
jgi:sulfur carrier protein